MLPPCPRTGLDQPCGPPRYWRWLRSRSHCPRPESLATAASSGPSRDARIRSTCSGRCTCCDPATQPCPPRPSVHSTTPSNWSWKSTSTTPDRIRCRWPREMQQAAHAARRARRCEGVLGSDYASINEQAQKSGVDLGMLDAFAPWFVAIALLDLELAKRGFSPEFGIEQTLAARAIEEHKPIEGLETAAQQFQMLAGMPLPQQKRFLVMTLDESAQLDTELEDLLRAWRSGDTEALARLLAGEYEEFPASGGSPSTATAPGSASCPNCWTTGTTTSWSWAHCTSSAPIASWTCCDSAATKSRSSSGSVAAATCSAPRPQGPAQRSVALVNENPATPRTGTRPVTRRRRPAQQARRHAGPAAAPRARTPRRS